MEDRDIGDAGLANLKGLTKLKVLLFDKDGEITDSGLAVLKDLPALEYVSVTHTKVTEAAAKAFQETRPKVKVVIK